ncbi:3'-5' exonuclease [Arenibacter sp. GZD96]|uniref:3'-5' exonuclease n=1 Tax=Aurantibrevibacter litoralis TaxID=3106030 RepID=UPI002AFFEAEC|nr:3'-5' exonuclease [Arenibacter sp. GZD-96]MEA1787636.1 3'-5' exonuclease [Arenibacter sp. GZD-96]
MISIFKKKPPLPAFWEAYEAAFKEKPNDNLWEQRFVVLDTETTGFDYNNDRILSIGALSLQHHTIIVNAVFEVYLHQDYYNVETAKVHCILKKGEYPRISEYQALQQFLAYVGNAIIVAHHAQFDLNMLNRALSRNGLPKLKNRVLDTSTLYKKTLIRSPLLTQKEQYSLDELADKFDISKKDRHTALGDAYITALVFLKVLGKLRDKKVVTLRKILRIR